MSEPKLISPLLDGFAIGGPISDHNGVRCCPAMPEASDKKYIVKIISIPSSQVQLEALLLTGAYPDEAAALEYFKELADGVVAEIEILNKLSKIEGFLPCENWQVVPMDNGTGYEVYLLTPYRRSLDRYMRKHTMTHLAAVNLGLDLCASLAVCRQAGYLYKTLKPGNVYINEDGTYSIGDIGFVSLDSLKYASIQDKDRSIYTAPEIADAFSALNTTLDVYAVGMILYQAYSGGTLPFQSVPTDGSLEPPIYADYEMAEIILKALDPDPQIRWHDPVQMGQALVAYMQRNSVNDNPIVPVPISYPEEDFEEEPADEDISDVEPDVTQIALDGFPEDAEPAAEDAEDTEEEPEDAPLDEDDPANLSFMSQLVADDTAPSEDMAPDVSYQELSDEMCDILAIADNLISHDAPAPVVAPDPIEIPMPVMPVTEIPSEPKTEEPTLKIDLPLAADDASTKVLPNISLPEDNPAPEAEADAEDEYEEEFYYEKPRKNIAKKIFGLLLVLLLLAGLVGGGYWFYTQYYIRTVSALVLEGSEDRLVVSVTADVDESLLTVICTDINGNSTRATVKDGIAVFEGLNPNSYYSIKVEVSGLRKLTGEISDSYTTPSQTEIVNFNAVTGTDNGSVILSFTVNGMDADSWTITYNAVGEQPQAIVFSGHMLTINGLQENKNYTFTLSSDSDVYLVGNDTVEYTVYAPVYPENLAIVSCTDVSLEVKWDAPAGSDVRNWIVRCYNNAGYNQTLTTTETTAVFTGLDTSMAYTVDVTAEGMSGGDRCYMTANSVTIQSATATFPNANTMKLDWEYTGKAPNAQWMILYRVDGSDYQEMVRSDKNSVEIKPYIPGSTYEFEIQMVGGGTVFKGTFTAETPEAKPFEGYLLSKDTITTKMCVTPNKKDWTRADLKAEDYTDNFMSGSKASFLLNSGRTYNTSYDKITVLYVIRNEDGKLVSNSFVEHVWLNMWYQRYCELDVPAIPEKGGTYTIEVYFNGASVHEQTFYVTPAPAT